MSEDEEASSIETTDYIHSDEFKEIIKKAAPARLKIMTELTPEMKDIKEDFVTFMNNGEKGLSDEAKKENTKRFRKLFKRLVDFHHYQGGWPKPNSPAKLDTLADNVELALKFFDYAGITTFRDKLAQRGIFIDDNKSRTLKDDYPDLTDGTSSNLKKIFDDGSYCQGEICNSADEIKINIYGNDLPEEVKCSSANKCGIKKGAFNKMVTAEAMKSLKTNEKMRKTLENFAATSECSIKREEHLRDRYLDMLDEQ